jgi:CheY-like chemotaxis protein
VGRRLKVLLVDDDPVVTEYLEMKLEDRYDVVTVNDPTRVVALTRSEQPDFIVCDIDMPVMDGGAVCRALADAPETCHIPVVYLTSILNVDDGGQPVTWIGGRPGISKHAPIDEILARIRAVSGG